MATCAFVGGETLGLGIQEARAAVSDQLQSVFEGNHDEQTRRTLLAGVFRNNGHGAEHHGMGQALNGHTKMALPPGYHLVENKSGGWDLTEGHDKHIGALTFDKQGHLSEASRQLLEHKGYHLGESTAQTTASHTIHETVSRTPDDYINQHPEKFTHVTRELWYDNNTPQFDQNELRMDWGGLNASGMNANGDYVFNVAGMTPDGSFHDGLSANAMQLAHEGKLAVALSFTDGTQNYVHLVQIDAAGNAVMSHNDPVIKSLFENQGGQAHFLGRYAETVQLMGTNPDGTEGVRMLATVGGDGTPHPVTDVISHVETTHGNIVTTTLDAPATEKPIEIPFVAPLYGRRGLERLQPEVFGYGYGYGYGQSGEYWRRWRQERSPRLRLDPDADLNTGEELAWYRQEQSKVRGVEYLQEIDDYINSNESLKNIGDETKAVVCIPVAAANESENIYRTLSMFAQQDEEPRNASVILLNVNWKQSLESNPEEMEKIRKTQSEIARAQADFPGLRIAAFNKVWSDDFVRSKKGKIYGEVIKVLYDTAAFALDKGVKDGRRQSATEALLITNDADTLGMSRNYLRNYIRALDRNPKADVFSATIRRGTESYKDFPGYGVASEFYALLNMMMQRQQKVGNGGFTTEGPNSGIRMSMYAAIGGCEDRIGAGADAVLGQRIAAARREAANPAGWRRLRLGKPRPGSERVIGQYVGGAQVDTLPDRLLGAYRQGKWIARGWDSFDNGGYEGRDVSMSAGTLDHEDPATDIDAIARRIETSIEGFASHWYRDPAVVSSALAFCFGVSTDDNSLYEYTWDWSKSGDGAFTFKFTDAGKRQLQNRLLRDRRGQYDPFGSRLQRQLYNRTNGGAKHPRLANPRMVA